MGEWILRAEWCFVLKVRNCGPVKLLERLPAGQVTLALRAPCVCWLSVRRTAWNDLLILWRIQQALKGNLRESLSQTRVFSLKFAPYWLLPLWLISVKPSRTVYSQMPSSQAGQHLLGKGDLPSTEFSLECLRTLLHHGTVMLKKTWMWGLLRKESVRCFGGGKEWVSFIYSFLLIHHVLEACVLSLPRQPLGFPVRLTWSWLWLNS